MSLDDALTLAGQVLADYEASGLAAAAGAEGIWPGRLAQALRDLSSAAAAWYASPCGAPSAAALEAAVRQLQQGITRIEAQAARLEAASTVLAGRAAAPSRDDGWRRLIRAITDPRERTEPGSVLLSAAEADTAWQAAADAAAWHARYGDCAGCVTSGSCSDPARHYVIVVAYAKLRKRLDGERR